MRNAKQFRDMARHVLTGRYWWAVLAGLIAWLLGASAGSGFRFEFSLPVSEHILTVPPELDLDSLGRITESLSRLPGRFPLGLTGLPFGSLFSLALLFVGAAVTLGYKRYHLWQYQDAKAPGIGILFSRFDIFWRAVGLRMLMFVKIFAWTLLFVVPGIVATYRYALAPYILAENPDMPAKAAIERSKELMRGHKSRLFGLHLSFFGWFLLVLLTGGVTFLLLVPYCDAAVTGFYLERIGRLPLPEVQAAAPVGEQAGGTQPTDSQPQTELI